MNLDPHQDQILEEAINIIINPPSNLGSLHDGDSESDDTSSTIKSLVLETDDSDDENETYIAGVDGIDDGDTDTQDDNKNIKLNVSQKDNLIIALANLKYDIGPQTPTYGCRHYMNRCDIYAECCKEFFSCYLCHNSTKYDNEDDYDKAHKIERNSIKKIKCDKCKKEQDVSQNCIECGLLFGLHYCKKCAYFDDVDRNIYHCDKCGICRVGAGSSYNHCDKCDLCFKSDIDHICIAATDCPICTESLGASTISIVKIERCGHPIHYNCLLDLLKTDYRCPICKISIGDQTARFQAMDEHVFINTMPDEYKDKMVDIYCHDCRKVNNVNFHFVGMKCPDCSSYNTKL